MAGRIVMALACAAVASAAGAGFMVLGSPVTQREYRLDERRLDDLSTLSIAVDQFRSGHQRMPASLGEIETGGATRRFRDPVTAHPYEYRILGGDRYELCANFYHQGEFYAGRWAHGTGRHCFARVAFSPQALGAVPQP